MTSSNALNEDDLDRAAKLAGITLTPEFRRGTLERLQELREGVLCFADGISEDAVPAIRFSAE